MDVEQFYKMVYRTANLTLSEICWNSGELFSFDQSRCFSPRVDPTAVCKENRDTPLELSMRFSGPEMRRLLGEFTEMPVDIKLFHLSTLSTDEDKEEFKDMLRSLPMELVSYSVQYIFFKTLPCKGRLLY